MTGAASPSELEGDFEDVQYDDLVGYEEDEVDIPKEIDYEEADADNEVMKLEQMLGRPKDPQKEARAVRGFEHPKGGG